MFCISYFALGIFHQGPCDAKSVKLLLIWRKRANFGTLGIRGQGFFDPDKADTAQCKTQCKICETFACYILRWGFCIKGWRWPCDAKSDLAWGVGQGHCPMMPKIYYWRWRKMCQTLAHIWRQWVRDFLTPNATCLTHWQIWLWEVGGLSDITSGIDDGVKKWWWCFFPLMCVCV